MPDMPLHQDNQGLHIIQQVLDRPELLIWRLRHLMLGMRQHPELRVQRLLLHLPVKLRQRKWQGHPHLRLPLGYPPRLMELDCPERQLTLPRRVRQLLLKWQVPRLMRPQQAYPHPQTKLVLRGQQGLPRQQEKPLLRITQG